MDANIKDNMVTIGRRTASDIRFLNPFSGWARKSHEVYIYLITETNSVLSARWFVQMNHDRSVLSATAKRNIPREEFSRRELQQRRSVKLLLQMIYLHQQSVIFHVAKWPRRELSNDEASNHNFR